MKFICIIFFISILFPISCVCQTEKVTNKNIIGFWINCGTDSSACEIKWVHKRFKKYLVIDHGLSDPFTGDGDPWYLKKIQSDSGYKLLLNNDIDSDEKGNSDSFTYQCEIKDGKLFLRSSDSEICFYKKDEKLMKEYLFRKKENDKKVWKWYLEQIKK
ncbi:MAG: hypothetical protein ACXVPU_12630 [Bacteroidia bacterium]